MGTGWIVISDSVVLCNLDEDVWMSVHRAATALQALPFEGICTPYVRHIPLERRHVIRVCNCTHLVGEFVLHTTDLCLVSELFIILPRWIPASLFASSKLRVDLY